MGYATETDYTTFTGGQSVSVALLNTASRDVDEILIGARYRTNTQGLPTDQAVIDALRDATCAQAQWLDSIGDTTGTGPAPRLKSASLGSATYQLEDGHSGDGATTVGGRQIAASAIGILRVAALLPTTPYVLG